MDRIIFVLILVTFPCLVNGHNGHQSGTGTNSGTSSSKTESQSIVDAHNKIRKAAKAVAMNKLTWSEELAANAGVHAKSCKNTPSNDTQRKNIGRFANVGENTFFSYGRKANYNAALKAWLAESKHYDINRHVCGTGKTCSNFTQLIWSDTEQVGCSSTKCDVPGGKKPRSGFFLVCQYGPSGNKQDTQPFVKASSPAQICSQCPKGSVCITKENLCSPPAESTLLPSPNTENGNNKSSTEETVDVEVEVDGDRT